MNILHVRVELLILFCWLFYILFIFISAFDVHMITLLNLISTTGPAARLHATGYQLSSRRKFSLRPLQLRTNACTY